MITKFSFSVLLATLMMSTASAGVITISPLSNNETDIVNTGLGVISAVNFGEEFKGNTSNPANPTVTLNGITHLAGSTRNNTESANNTSATHLIASSVITTNTEKNGVGVVTGYWGDFRSPTGYSGDMESLMDGIAGNNAGFTMDIGGLTIGQNYLFQGYWENGGQTGTITFEGTDTQSGISGGTGGLGTLITYEFTATDTQLNVSFSSTTGDWLQGYSLQIPEPSSTILLGMGAATILIRRRS